MELEYRGLCCTWTSFGGILARTAVAVDIGARDAAPRASMSHVPFIADSLQEVIYIPRGFPLSRTKIENEERQNPPKANRKEVVVGEDEVK